MAGPFVHEKFGAELGFLDKTDKWRLESRFFPSKVGGKPAWLDLKNLPPTEQLLCKCCQKPVTFLAQVYAPDDDDEAGTRVIKETCYHRTIYIFFCTAPLCNKKNSNENFVVFRSQLAKENEFYPPIDPPDDPDWKKDLVVSKFTKVCMVCGCLGTKLCGGCRNVNYCTKDHQVLHWKNGHKMLCKEPVRVEGEDSMFTLPEYEIIIEDEKIEDKASKLSSSDETELKEFEKILKEKNPTFQDDETITESLEESVADVQEDKMFLKFKEKIDSYPDQVLRYGKGETPLWVSDSNTPSSVPDCEYCGSERRFEFQIMPQMLNYLQLDSISQGGVDWGTLLIYVCKNNCDSGPTYKNEFLWKQDFSGQNSI
ncbi:Zinc finger protein RP-8 [Daphnia magna]|uniref:Zinc finger protein RP-8 n=1 Tax=Daphnia magna TaxID=35525 RepID=A0A164W3Q3_9CRUS|nr:Zinc finger protein RP-8 [Daphnia magna]